MKFEVEEISSTRRKLAIEIPADRVASEFERAFRDVSRRAHIRGTDMPRPGIGRVSAAVPLSELEGFPARLKSLTAGEGSYTLAFSHYDPAPATVQQRLVAAHTPKVEED